MLQKEITVFYGALRTRVLSVTTYWRRVFVSLPLDIQDTAAKMGPWAVFSLSLNTQVGLKESVITGPKNLRSLRLPIEHPNGYMQKTCPSHVPSRPDRQNNIWYNSTNLIYHQRGHKNCISLKLARAWVKHTSRWLLKDRGYLFCQETKSTRAKLPSPNTFQLAKLFWISLILYNAYPWHSWAGTGHPKMGFAILFNHSSFSLLLGLLSISILQPAMILSRVQSL